jgi:hypothetical protein
LSGARANRNIMAFPETKADRPQTEISPGRKMLITGIAVLAFVLTCAGLNAIIPLPEIDVVSPNLRFFLQHRDDFDTLFIGSSRIRHQISPAIFDRTMGAAGFPTRTFNFGVNAMVPPENGYVLERLLGARPRHLKWVFIELDELHTKRVPETEGTRRALYWHDGKRTAIVLRAILDAGRQESGFALLGKLGQIALPGSGNSEARDLFFFHSKLFVTNFTNIGRKIELARWISHLWKAEVLSNKMGSAGDGYVPLSEKMSAAETVIYRAELDYAVTHAGSRFVSVATEDAYRDLAEEVRKAGATPIFLVTPLAMQIKLGFRPEAGIASPVMLFNNATVYPQLYRKEMRIDRSHLNNVAAEEFTRLVAENFLQLRRENRIQ